LVSPNNDALLIQTWRAIELSKKKKEMLNFCYNLINIFIFK